MQAETILFDYNGTLANEGYLSDLILEELIKLSSMLHVIVVTADTFGTVRKTLANTKIEVAVIGKEKGSIDKAKLVETYKSQGVIAVGNGSNDQKMMMAADLAIGILGEEGISGKALREADLVFKDIHHVFDILLNSPKALIATLRE